MAEREQEEPLKQEIGVRSLTLAIFNSIVGTGIFVIPGLIAESLGTFAIIAYLVCGALIFLIGLCFAELGSKQVISGGPISYIEKAFGNYAGFISNIIFSAGCTITDAAFSMALIDIIKIFFPAIETGIYKMLFLIVLFGGLAYLNISGLKKGMRVLEIITFGKMIPLVILAVLGFRYMAFENLTWVGTPNFLSIGASSLFLFFAFQGMEVPLCNSGEIKDAKRTVPLGIFFGIVFVLVFYLAIQMVTQGVLGKSIVQYKSAPLAALATVVFGSIGSIIITITTFISVLGTLNADILSIPRTVYAGAKVGHYPKLLARVHHRYFTPHFAIIIYASIGCLLAIFSVFKELLILSAASTLMIYLGVVLSTVKLRKRSSNTQEREGFKIPGGLLVPILAICIIVWLLSNLSKAELIGTLIFILLGSGIYCLNYYRRFYSSKVKRLID